MRVTITFKDNGLIPVDIRRLQPTVIKGMSASEIERIEVSFGNRSCLVGDLAVVNISQRDENNLILSGHTRRLVNTGYLMDGGILVIEGDAGNSVGMGMQGGLIHVRGSVGDRCGANQPGQAGRNLF
jgi:formylmethanofuran dehydrogenase subunit C